MPVAGGLACGHDAVAFGAPLCAHLQACRQPWLSCVRWYLGVGPEMEVLCAACADLRQTGTAVIATRVCQPCFTHAIEDIADLVGMRGEPGVAERAAPFATTLVTTALPVELGPIADLAPVHDESGSIWLLLATSGALRRRLHASSCGDFAAVANDYGRHGQVLDLRSGRVTMTLDGGDYHPETVPFSLAFFEARGRTVVIHRSDWNRLDLSDPASGELLTVRETPGFGEDRKQPPHYLDYFHGGLVP